MLSVEIQSPSEIARTLAERVKSLRLDRGWTQQELAERAGLALETYRVFERSGRISLERLIRLAFALDALTGVGRLFERPPVRTLAELERLDALSTRKRGRRRDADA